MLDGTLERTGIARPTSRLVVWRGTGLHESPAPRLRLPTIEDFTTQIAPGPSGYSWEILATDRAVLARVRNRALSIGGLVLEPDYFIVTLPLTWAGEYLINGVSVEPGTMHLTANPNGCFSRCAERDMMAVVLRRADFVATLAALRGVDPEEIGLADGGYRLTPAAARSLGGTLAALLTESLRAKAPGAEVDDPQDVTDALIGAVADAFLFAQRTAPTSRRRGYAPERIVRKALARFESAGGRPISLADLCTAAGVGQTALYGAFQGLYGEPPLSCFRKRRLVQARARLLSAPPDRGAVKRVALGLGLTELGRFSREYRQMFGESPSTTLNRAGG